MANKEKKSQKKLPPKKNRHAQNKKIPRTKKPQDKKSRDYIAISATPIIFLRRKYQIFFHLVADPPDSLYIGRLIAELFAEIYD